MGGSVFTHCLNVFSLQSQKEVRGNPQLENEIKSLWQASTRKCDAAWESKPWHREQAGQQRRSWETRRAGSAVESQQPPPASPSPPRPDCDGIPAEPHSSALLQTSDSRGQQPRRQPAEAGWARERVSEAASTTGTGDHQDESRHHDVQRLRWGQLSDWGDWGQCSLCFMLQLHCYCRKCHGNVKLYHFYSLLS